MSTTRYPGDVSKAVDRWRLGLPNGALGSVDRAMVATLLSFGSELNDDSAIEVALILCDRTERTLRARIKRCRRTTEIGALCDALASLDAVQQSLCSISPGHKATA